MKNTKTVVRRLLPYAALAALLLAGCAKNDDTASSSASSSGCQLPSGAIVLAYAHSTDYTTYKLDWIEKDGSNCIVRTNQITLSPSGGLRSPTAVGDYILIVDSSSSGRLLAYKRSDLTLAGQVNIGSYPQDMVTHNNVAYVADGNSNVKRIDIANLPTMTALSDINVGDKPTVVRKWGGKIYVGNQDWLTRSQASVSVIDPATNTVTDTFDTGPNNMDIAYDGTRIWTHNADWYNNMFVCQNTASLTYAPVSTYTPTNITPPAPYATNSNCTKGSLAFNNTTGYAILRQGSGGFHLFTISGTTLNDPPIDSTNRYVFVGNTTQYLAKVHNGDGSTNNLTVVIEDLNNNVLTTQTLTKDTDMYFFLNP
jgi:hypothetical protein